MEPLNRPEDMANLNAIHVFGTVQNLTLSHNNFETVQSTLSCNSAGEHMKSTYSHPEDVNARWSREADNNPLDCARSPCSDGGTS